MEIEYWQFLIFSWVFEEKSVFISNSSFSFHKVIVVIIALFVCECIVIAMEIKYVIILQMNWLAYIISSAGPVFTKLENAFSYV